MVSVLDELQDADLVDPFTSSTQEVFETMLQCTCHPGEIETVAAGTHMHAVTAVIGLSGKMSGAISISTTSEGALTILERMTGLEATEVDDFVRDAFGEMANMIAGKGKRDLWRYELRLGLPQVIVGDDYTIYSPRWAKHYWLSLNTDFAPCTLDIGFDGSLSR